MVDFSKFLKKPLQPKPPVKTIRVIARDCKGNEFRKDVTLETLEDGGKPVLNFGWPVQYYVESLKKSYPFTKPLTIDMCGLNHKGFPDVEISPEQMNRFFEFFELT